MVEKMSKIEKKTVDREKVYVFVIEGDLRNKKIVSSPGRQLISKRNNPNVDDRSFVI